MRFGRLVRVHGGPTCTEVAVKMYEYVVLLLGTAGDRQVRVPLGRQLGIEH
jgi:hypothetical protein